MPYCLNLARFGQTCKLEFIVLNKWTPWFSLNLFFFHKASWDWLLINSHISTCAGHRITTSSVEPLAHLSLGLSGLSRGRRSRSNRHKRPFITVIHWLLWSSPSGCCSHRKVYSWGRKHQWHCSTGCGVSWQWFLSFGGKLGCDVHQAMHNHVVLEFRCQSFNGKLLDWFRFQNEHLLSFLNNQIIYIRIKLSLIY